MPRTRQRRSATIPALFAEPLTAAGRESKQNGRHGSSVNFGLAKGLDVPCRCSEALLHHDVACFPRLLVTAQV